MALMRTNQSPISTLDDNSSLQAKMCNLVYEQARRALLSKYNWSFAIKYDADIKPTDHQEYDNNNNPLPLKTRYRYEYTFPHDYLRLVAVYHGDNRPVVPIPDSKLPYVLEGKSLWSYYPDLRLKYINDVKDVNSMPESFIDCLALDIALRISKYLNDSSVYLQQLQMALMNELELAKQSDCQQTLLDGVMSYPTYCYSMSF
jgi:hypothetical protein